MNNYRNNMPHYDSLPHHYNPMGINEHKNLNNNRMQFATGMPGMPQMPEDMLQMPFISDTEMPLEIDGDMPALPGMPQQGIPSLIPPWMPQMPGMQQPQMPMMPGIPGMPGMPTTPGMQQPQMPMMPGMPGTPRMPQAPGMQQPQMPMMPQMPQMPGMPPQDGNMYPMMPGMPPVTCEQLREMMTRMNCPMNGEESGATTPADEDM
ncbi:MAG: hypothetical protein PHP29_01200 [Tissierellia bacterium]|nr:hypothetical protein [Tissierellia bacterium]